ncbi:MAG: DUF4105 domain-containing protein [Lentisphaerae bacterium]|nr:DUF4105 domain-containing protein [Lentisphaerota bacterium]
MSGQSVLIPRMLILRKIKRIVRFFLHLILFAAGLWCLAAMPPVLKLPELLMSVFSIALTVLFIGSFINRHAFILLAVTELTFLLYFLSLNPQKQFAGVEFERIFAVKPAIKYLENGDFEVINLRNNSYPDNYDEKSADYPDVFVNRSFSPDKVTSMQLAQVYWNGMDYVAHTMLNFKFSDGKELAVSIEPRTPVGVDRKNFTHLCRQHELLIILSVPSDLFDLRTRIRGEDLYLYDLDLSPAECRIILQEIIAKVDKLNREPEFYDLIRANCITAIYPAFKIAKPDLRGDIRVLFNGYFDRMLFENGIIKHHNGESFESLKSRSFVKGKSQGKL